MGMAEDVVEDLRARIAKTLDDLRRELAKVRTGRANPALLEGVRVDYYGTLSPLQNVANVTVSDPRLIVIKPWEKSMITVIEKAINASGLGLNAMSDAALVDKYENALKVIESQGKEPGAAVQVLVHDIQREVQEIQAAVKKEFPGNASFQSIFKAQEPTPQAPREVLGLGRLIAKEAPEFAQNLIKYAINAATVKHLTSLCDQLEKEIGGFDPVQEAKVLEDQ